MNEDTHNPYTAPDSDLGVASLELEYVGFWARTGAAVLDSLLVLAVTFPVLNWVYGKDYFLSDKFLHGPLDFVISYVFPAVAVISFWVYRSATPGKIAIGAKIVDARTGKRASAGQLIGRYFAYFPSALPLGLGCFWVGWDPQKQGWHDHMAGTLVVRDTRPAQRA